MDFFGIKGNRKLSIKYWAHSITLHNSKNVRIEGVPSEPSQKKKKQKCKSQNQQIIECIKLKNIKL